jgi:hypothetical protein
MRRNPLEPIEGVTQNDLEQAAGIGWHEGIKQGRLLEQREQESREKSNRITRDAAERVIDDVMRRKPNVATVTEVSQEQRAIVTMDMVRQFCRNWLVYFRQAGEDADVGGEAIKMLHRLAKDMLVPEEYETWGRTP